MISKVKFGADAQHFVVYILLLINVPYKNKQDIYIIYYTTHNHNMYHYKEFKNKDNNAKIDFYLKSIREYRCNHHGQIQFYYNILLIILI